MEWDTGRMREEQPAIAQPGQHRWGWLTVLVPLLLGNGFLITLALYDRETNVNFKLQVAFGAIWTLVAVVRAFQLGRRW